MIFKCKKASGALLLLLCLTCLLSSCSFQKGPLQEYYRDDCYEEVFDQPSFDTYEELTQFVGWAHQMPEEGSSLIYFHHEKQHAIYNAILNKTVLEVTDGTVEIRFLTFQNGVQAFCCVDTEDKKLTLYQADGTEVFSKDYDPKTSKLPTVVFDLLCYGDSYYRVTEEGYLQHAFEKSPLDTTAQRIDRCVAGYYYVGTASSRVILVYDENLEPLSSCTLPSYAKSPRCIFLANGNLLIQYTIELPENEKKYDLMQGTKKYNLVTLLFDVEKEKSREIKVDYYLSYGSSRTDWAETDQFECFTEDVENIVCAYEIRDKRVEENDVRIYSLSNKGKVERVLNDLVPRQGDNLPVAASPERYVLKNDLGQKFLLNERGEVLIELDYSAIVGENYIYYQNAVYDHYLNLVYRYEEEMTVQASYDKCIVLRGNETENTYVFANGKSEPLITKVGGLVLYLFSKSNCFMTYNPGTKNNNFYFVYNEEGTMLRRFATANLPNYELSDGKMLAVVYDADATEGEKPRYYIFS